MLLLKLKISVHSSCLIVLAFSVATAFAEGTSDAAADADRVGEVKEMLDHLRDGNLWGEALLEGNRIRPIKVESTWGDSVSVVEVVGPLRERSASYNLHEIRSIRELGEFRIQLRRAPFREKRSRLAALALETVIPGGGYFYIGESDQGLLLLGLSAVATGTAFASGRDGLAAWLPLVAWVKVGSLIHLFQEVSSMNAGGD